MASSGRPRAADISAAILEAVAEIAIRDGYSKTTVDKVVRLAGTSKPAFYRRYRDIADTVPVLLAAEFGTDDDVDTGSVVTDFLEIQKRQCALFDHPLTRGVLCGYLDAVSASPAAAAPFINGYLTPRRAYTSVVLQRAVDRGEIPGGADADFIADLLTGPALMRGVLPGMPPIDDALIRRTVDVVLTYIGYTGDRSPLASQ